MEKIICAAIWLPTWPENMIHLPKNITEGVVICGYRHGHCFAQLHALGIIMKEHAIQGFLTDQNRFLNREEAFKLAEENGQLIESKWEYRKISNCKELFSEDLY